MNFFIGTSAWVEALLGRDLIVHQRLDALVVGVVQRRRHHEQREEQRQRHDHAVGRALLQAHRGAQQRQHDDDAHEARHHDEDRRRDRQDRDQRHDLHHAVGEQARCRSDRWTGRHWRRGAGVGGRGRSWRPAHAQRRSQSEHAAARRQKQQQRQQRVSCRLMARSRRLDAECRFRSRWRRRARQNQMLDIVAADDEKALARPDHQCLDDRKALCADGFDDAGHAEAARGEAGGADQREHQKQRAEIAGEYRSDPWRASERRQP